MMTLLTVATRSSRYMPYFLESCARAGLEPTILGRGRRWTGFGMKLTLLQAALSALPRKRLVLFSDAHDSIFVRPAEVILKSYEKLAHPLVFSAEKYCSPDPWKSFIYPPTASPWKFLNSGGFIGEAGAAWRILRDLAKKVPSSLNDQKWWTNRYLENPDRIRLDTQCEIFQTLYGSLEDLQLRKQIYNRVTRSRPSIIHANGWSDMKPILKWYHGKFSNRSA